METVVILLLVIFGLLGLTYHSSKKASDYIFVNSTASAWEARLLPNTKLMEFADAPDIKNILSALSETEYGKLLEKDEAIDIEKLERRLHLHLVEKFRGLISMIPRDRRRTVELLLQRTDLMNLKAIISMIHLGVPKEDRKKQLLPSLTPPERSELLSSAATIEELMEFLKDSDYFETLSEAIQQKVEPRLLPSALDKRYYSVLWQEVLSRKSQRRVLMQIVGYLIDSTNAKTILRLKKEGVPPEEIERYLIRPFFELKDEMIKAMLAAETLSDAIHMIRITFVGRILKEVAEEIELKGIEIAETALERGFLKLCRGLAMTDFFSIAPALNYIALKENEVRNLRFILRMKVEGIEPDEIKKGIVEVPKIEL